MPALPADKTEPFAASRELFSAMESYLMSKDARNLTHSELERELEKRGLELMRSLLQAHHGTILLVRDDCAGAAFLVTLPAYAAVPTRKA